MKVVAKESRPRGRTMELKTQKYSASLTEWKGHNIFTVTDNTTNRPVLNIGKTKVLALKAVLTEFVRYAESLEKAEAKRLEEAEKTKEELSKKVLEVSF